MENGKKYVNIDILPTNTKNRQVDLDKYHDIINKNLDKKITEILKIIKEKGYTKEYGFLKYYVKK